MIRGYIENDSPLIDCMLTFPSISADLRLQVTFLIDTGASVSLLHPRDAIRFGLDLASLAADPRSERARSMSGVARFIRTTALLDFDEDVPRPRSLRHPIGIAEANSGNEMLPSILGMDFLKAFRLTVSVREHRVELEPLFKS